MDFIEVILSSGNIAWARGGKRPLGSTHILAPMDVWRFKYETAASARAILDAICSYQGSVKWSLSKPGRNWVLLPAAFAEFTEAEAELYALNNQAEVKLIREDYNRLTEYVRSAISALSEQ